MQRFEEIPVWQDARKMAQQVYRVTKSGDLSKDYGLKDQIQRASVSIMSNIAEGYERDSNREFAKFLTYAKGSSGEVRSLLYIALDQGYIDDKTFETLAANAVNISKQISGFQKYLRKTAH